MRTRTARIAVAGDIHLGKRQYNNAQREKDFQDAWLWVCGTVAEKNPDFFILTGDLFDSKVVGPVTLSCAVEGLSTPGLGVVLAVEGNHDGRSFIHKGRSWLEYLSDQGYIDHILRPNEPYRDGEGLFFCGSPWAGRKTKEAFEGMAWDAEIGAGSNDFKIGVIHAAPEGYVPGAGSIPADMLSGNLLDMTFMGHCHKPFNIGGKAFCGGSPEVYDIGEIGDPGGVWIIDVAINNKCCASEFIKYEPRPFTRLWFDSRDIVSGGPRKTKYYFGIPPFAEKPVVIIDIGGERVHIDTSSLLDGVQSALDPLLIRVNDRMVVARTQKKNVSGPESFREAVEPLLGNVTFGEFSAVFDIYDRRDEDARKIERVLEGSDDK